IVTLTTVGYGDISPTTDFGQFLAAIAILIPRRFVLKHWAYAGMIFTLIFAIVAHQSVGDPFILQIIGILLTLVSYYFYLTRMSFPSLPFMKIVPTTN
ncbi:MAG: DoxX family protein, partial [Bacteroidota bacterium]